MSWQLGPVVRGIRGHRSAATLVAIQFGLGLAITVLAVLIADYFRQAPPLDGGSADDNLVVIELQLARADVSRIDAVVATIAATPNCVGAAIADNLPLHALEIDIDEATDFGINASTAPGATGATQATAIGGGAGFARAAGMTLRAGRDFETADITSARQRADVAGREATPALVSPAMADVMWPGQSPLGMRFVSRAYGPAVVIGVAEQASQLFGDGPVAIYAHVDHGSHVVILARSEPGRAADLQAALVGRLQVTGQHADIRPAREHMAQRARPIGPVLGILGILVGTILLVVLMGSMGLTYFLVASRTREIGLRRAMGATRDDTVRYFLLENAIVTVVGAVVGLAIVLAVLPALTYEQEGYSTNWLLVAGTSAAVCLLNLFATWIPARRAATVPPVVASRSA